MCRLRGQRPAAAARPSPRPERGRMFKMKQKASPADVPVYLFKQGNNFESQRFFGAHFEGDFVTFRTYAPGAQAVELIGEFNGWQGMPMAREGQGGVFSCRIQGAKPGMLYKYKIRPAAGGEADHCDP